MLSTLCLCLRMIKSINTPGVIRREIWSLIGCWRFSCSLEYLRTFRHLAGTKSFVKIGPRFLKIQESEWLEWNNLSHTAKRFKMPFQHHLFLRLLLIHNSLFRRGESREMCQNQIYLKPDLWEKVDRLGFVLFERE